MLAFRGDNEALTARKFANCTIPLYRSSHCNRTVSNSNIIVTEALLL